jgi:thioredoxin-like negative regulator of GroEL
MRFEVFGKSNCAKCESTKAKLAHLVSKSQANAPVAFVDLGTIEGLAEGAYNDVRDVPTVILRADGGAPLARWDGKIPPSVEVQALLGGSSVAGAAP